MKYRRKAALADAMQLLASCTVTVATVDGNKDSRFEVHPGDWLIQDERGMFSKLEHEEFWRAYEVAPEEIFTPLPKPPKPRKPRRRRLRQALGTSPFPPADGPLEGINPQ